jgi:hypothetical protein
VGCCEERVTSPPALARGRCWGALGLGVDDNNTARGCRAEESVRASVRLCESWSKGRGAGVRESQRLSFVQGGLG